jgi:hypothetical protein
VEREEDRLPCSSTEEMPAGGAEPRWKGRRGGEGSMVESAVVEAERGRGVVSRCCGEVRFFFFLEQLGASGCWPASWPTIDTVRIDGHPIPSITV